MRSEGKCLRLSLCGLIVGSCLFDLYAALCSLSLTHFACFFFFQPSLVLLSGLPSSLHVPCCCVNKVKCKRMRQLCSIRQNARSSFSCVSTAATANHKCSTTCATVGQTARGAEREGNEGNGSIDISCVANNGNSTS